MFARILCRWRPSAVLPWSITTTTATILPLFGNTFAGYIIRPENWRDALPESVRDLDTFTIYRGSSSDISRAPLSLSWSLSYDVAEWFARRNNFLYQLPVHVYQATIKADKIIAYLNYRNEFEVLQYRNIKDVQEIAPLRGTVLYTTHS